jgi:hypothetical protein
MAVLIESYSVVVRNATIADKYPGGMDAYPNATFCLDDHLCRVGFMVAQDAEVFAAARSRRCGGRERRPLLGRAR